MDGRGIGDNDLHVSCSQLAEEYPFAALLNSQALPAVGRSGLALDCALLQKLSREEARKERLSAVSAR